MNTSPCLLIRSKELIDFPRRDLSVNQRCPVCFSCSWSPPKSRMCCHHTSPCVACVLRFFPPCSGGYHLSNGPVTRRAMWGCRRYWAFFPDEKGKISRYPSQTD